LAVRIASASLHRPDANVKIFGLFGKTATRHVRTASAQALQPDVQALSTSKKIDGAVATLMALDRAAFWAEQLRRPVPKVYAF